MKTAFRWVILGLLLCSIPAFAEGPRWLQERGPGNAKPLIVDGVRFDRAEMEQFMGQRMYWVVEKDAIYGFSTPEAVEAFGRERDIAPRSAEQQGGVKGGLKNIVANDLTGCTAFNKSVGCGGADWKIMCPPAAESHLNDSWNDVISCVDAGSNVGKYTVLYKCYYYSPYPLDNCFDQILWVSPGTSISDLNAYNMNNVTSSIRFCSNIDPYTCSP